MRYTDLLRQWMERVNIESFAQLSRQATVSSWQVKQLRRGKITQMRLEILHQLAQTLQVSLSDLIIHFSDLPSLSPQTSSEDPQHNVQRKSLETLESWLLQWPTVCHAVEKNPQLPANRVIPLVQPVETLMEQWGVEIIAPVGAEIPYNPQEHELMDSTAQEGDIVRVRYAGYRYQGKLLHRARVSPFN